MLRQPRHDEGDDSAKDSEPYPLLVIHDADDPQPEKCNITFAKRPQNGDPAVPKQRTYLVRMQQYSEIVATL